MFLQTVASGQTDPQGAAGVSDQINRGLSLFVTIAVVVALLAAVNVPDNPARRLVDLFRQMF